MYVGQEDSVHPDCPKNTAARTFSLQPVATRRHAFWGSRSETQPRPKGSEHLPAKTQLSRWDARAPFRARNVVAKRHVKTSKIKKDICVYIYIYICVQHIRRIFTHSGYALSSSSSSTTTIITITIIIIIIVLVLVLVVVLVLVLILVVLLIISSSIISLCVRTLFYVILWYVCVQV